MSAPTLFGATYSVYTRIARLSLIEKGIAHSFEEVDIFDPAGPPSPYLRRHPFGRIPALAHDGFDLYETAAICRYVDEAFPGRALQPQTARDRARVAQIVGLLDSYAYRPMVWDIFVERVRKPQQNQVSDEAKIADAVIAAERCLDVLENLIGEAPWLAGVDEQPSLADLHAAPMLAYLVAARDGAALVERHPRIRAWLRRMSDRPSMRATPSPLIE